MHRVTNNGSRKEALQVRNLLIINWNVHAHILLFLIEQIINAEEFEFNELPSDANVSEISSLTSFARKAALD